VYVCLCHGIRCRQVKEAANQGVRTPAEVHKRHGVRPQCGRCMREIGEMLQSECGGCHGEPAE
jgi:bacterioferritin-associated ferredoxin